MYKVKNNIAPQQVCEIFLKHPKHYNLRNNDFPIPSFSSIKYGKHSIRYMGPYLWGKIDRQLRNKTSLAAFKKAVRNLNVLNILEIGRASCRERV